MSDAADVWPGLLLAALAAWRLTHLLAYEDGPAGLAAGLRGAMRRLGAGAAFDCFHCLSLWVAAPLALCVTTRPLSAALAWLAVSGAACLCERIGQPAVVMQAVPETADAGEAHELLRTKN